jgi:sensor histidine kinase YesM
VVVESQEAKDWKGVLKRFMILVPTMTVSFGLISGFITGDFPLSIGVSTTISCILFLIYALDCLYVQPLLQSQPRDRRMILEILLAVVETLAGMVAALWISSIIFGFSIMKTPIWTCVLIGFGTFMIFRSVRYAFQFYRDLKAKELVEERLQRLAAQAELKALKAQINPHFLFNTLNTIASLTHSSPQKAEETIEKLADMFRYALMSSDRGSVLLREELAFTRRYLEIEQARFGASLRIHEKIASDVLDISIPPLVIQPIVENAIRYGRGEDGSVDLRIQVSSQNGELVISVLDQGPGISPDFCILQSEGIGLRNVDERLRRTYGDMFGLEIGSNVPHGAAITFRIPFDRGTGAGGL